MRLIKISEGGSLSLTADLRNPNIPPYAILSHTWDDDQDEVKLQDFENGTMRGKSGFAKIDFCVKQAQRDELEYIWIDTCCVDQKNSVELNEAINSMFRWYQYAVKCYVYLVDVDASPATTSHWQSFAGSRWFTRGWTLQELLASRQVEFFDEHGTYLGNKEQLQSWLSRVTGIPEAALAGTPLTQFDVVERILWASERSTGREEDVAYALLGVLDVALTPAYGEEMSMALTRLYCKAFKMKQQHLSQHQKKQLTDTIRAFQNARWKATTQPQCPAFQSAWVEWIAQNASSTGTAATPTPYHSSTRVSPASQIPPTSTDESLRSHIQSRPPEPHREDTVRKPYESRSLSLWEEKRQHLAGGLDLPISPDDTESEKSDDEDSNDDDVVSQSDTGSISWASAYSPEWYAQQVYAQQLTTYAQQAHAQQPSSYAQRTEVQARHLHDQQIYGRQPEARQIQAREQHAQRQYDDAPQSYSSRAYDSKDHEVCMTRDVQASYYQTDDTMAKELSQAMYSTMGWATGLGTMEQPQVLQPTASTETLPAQPISAWNEYNKSREATRTSVGDPRQRQTSSVSNLPISFPTSPAICSTCRYRFRGPYSECCSRCGALVSIE